MAGAAAFTVRNTRCTARRGNTHSMPPRSLALRCACTGLGKTTLAHVCAAHCGYRPVEINASDDRSGGSLQAKILDAVEMQVGVQRY